MSSASFLSVAVASIAVAAFFSGGARLAELRDAAQHESRNAWIALQVGLREFPAEFAAAEGQITGYWHQGSTAVVVKTKEAEGQIKGPGR